MTDADSELLVPADGDIVVHELEIKKSRFITWIARTDDEESARALIGLAKSEFPDARHHCSAFIHEVPGGNRVERSSDDGEPSGTAGRPMLDVLQGSGLTNITAVVIRYFGGIKLGTGGLVRAYSDSVSQCLERVQRMRRTRRLIRKVSAPAWDAGRIESELRARGFAILETAWGENVEFSLAVSPEETAELDGTMQALTKGASAPSLDAGETWQEVPA
nr:YigZ family protein [Corynebacterium lactis]